MNIRRHELDVVAEVFPEFATTRKEEMTAGVFLQVKDGDRLLKEDLLEVFQRQIRGVEWVPSPGPKITTLIIELVRNNERVLPTQTQNITYGISEVNILDAALRMPVNASYAYELITDGAEIEYGYVVSAVLQGKVIHEKVIRGKVKGESVRCENARIQNALGGVTAANFVANDDMEQRCSGPCSVSLEDLRKQVFSEIVAGVLEVPTIKAVHEIN